VTETIQFTLNGSVQNVDIPQDATLLEMLRGPCGLISPKDGCSPQGQCGCCTVIVDGRAVVSCTIPAMSVAGRTVLTIEGFETRVRDVFADSFVTCGGVQCGFCTPGIVARAQALLMSDASPSEDRITSALNAHHCRCTGYRSVVDSIKMAAAALRGEELPAQEKASAVGSNTPRVDGRRLTLGEREFIDDMSFPGMLHGALLLSEHPRALIKSIDTRAASALSGVVAVVTAKDTPGQCYQGLIETDWPVFVSEGEETRYIGDVLAAVAANDRRTARTAIKLIKVKYEIHQPVTNPEDALKADAPHVHPGGNLLSKSTISRGDVSKALHESAHVVTRSFQTQFIEHMFLEPESCIALPKDDGLQIFSQGQGIFDDRRQVASFLDLPLEKVYVTLVSNGGAFGGKEDLSIQAQTALLAKVTARPVKLTLSREESFRLHPKRHPIRMTYTVGCDGDGNLTAVKARIIGDKGAYASVGSKVLERSAGHCVGPYKLDNVDVLSLAVYTNNPPCGAMRGFGVNQSAFAIESMLDILAEKVGIDGWEIRYRNALDVGDRFCTGQRLESSVGLKKTLEAVKDIYKKARYAGIACGIKNVGIGNGATEYGRAALEIHKDGIVIHTGYTEMGQGLFTVLLQTACEETGLPADAFSQVLASTKYELDCGQTTASRATFLGCLAVQDAAKKLKPDLAKVGLAGLVGRTYFGETKIEDTHPLQTDRENAKTHFAYGFATQVVILDEGGHIAKVIAAHDVGRVINPSLLKGQLEGSIHMGLGFALTEEFKVRNGVPRNLTVNGQGLIRARRMPEIEIILIEDKHPIGPYGAKGVGEIGLIPTAPAVAAALYRFDGIRRFKLPMRNSAASRFARGAANY
jgi:selenium-dependent xanthine dehydrogenase